MMKVHVLLGAAALLGALALGGCGREADRASRPDAAEASASSSVRTTSYQARQDRDETAAPAPARAYEDGKPMWAANKRHSGDENAKYQFGKNGSDLGAGSEDDYVARAHAFIDSPPKGSLSLARSNGDTLYYDPKGNLFVVADKDGAPRTMFKPRQGMAYWTQQKDRLASGDTGRSSGRGGQSGGEEDRG